MNEREQRVADRQDGDYRPPILTEPKGGPIPSTEPPGKAGSTT